MLIYNRNHSDSYYMTFDINSSQKKDKFLEINILY